MSDLAALREPFPAEAIDQLPKAGITLDYVGHAWITERLLDVDPAWSWEPVAFAEDGSPLVAHREKHSVLWIRLTVLGVTRLGVGIVESRKDELEKELISDALRNAAMRFGAALDLWKKHDTTTTPRSRAPRPAAAVAGEPLPPVGQKRAASDKQKKFLEKLIQDNYPPEGCAWPLPEFVAFDDARKWIDELQEAAKAFPKAERRGPDPVAVAALKDQLGAEEVEHSTEPL